jgi:CTP:molybdopterin cytidylyltransferase MocA
MSRRMGANKMLLPFGGRTVVATVIENLLSSGVTSSILVVTGHAAQEIENVAKNYPGVECVHNALYETGGMLSSVQAGVRELPVDCPAFLLALGDQPTISVQTVRAMLAAWHASDARIVLPICSGKRGHPVLFSGELRQEILGLAEPETLKTMTERYSLSICDVSVEDDGTLMDVDTPHDYELACRRLETAVG